MVKGSQLSQLKSALSNAGITKSQPSKKRKRPSGDAQLSEKDKKAAKLKEIHERMNPFDVKVTKLKHDVGGRKLKGVGGRPAASKQAGIEQVRSPYCWEGHNSEHRFYVLAEEHSPQRVRRKRSCRRHSRPTFWRERSYYDSGGADA